MSSLNKQVFARVMERLPVELRNDPRAAAVRYLATTAEEKARLKGARVLSEEHLFPDVLALTITDGTSHFVAWCGSPLVPLGRVRGIVDDKTQCAGLSTFIWAHHKCPLRDVDSYELAEHILVRAGGLSRGDVSRYFAPIAILQVEEAFVKGMEGDFSAQRAYAATMLSANHTTLPIAQDSRTRLLAILEAAYGGHLGDQLFRGVSAVHWQHMFLDIYRCIERLYALPYVLAANAKIGGANGSGGQSGVSAAVMERLLAETLGWKPKELEALVEVMRRCNAATVAQTLGVFSVTQPAQDAVSQLARLIYAVRNDCAHFRNGRLNGLSFDWAPLVENLILLLVEALAVYGPELL